MSSVAHLPARTLDRISPGILPAIGLTVCVAVGLSLLLPGHEAAHPAAWAVVAVAAVGFVPSLHPTGRAWWLRIGAVVYGVLIAALIATTGGPDSAYQDLLAVLLVSSAILKRWPLLLLDALVVFWAALSPVVYGPVPGTFPTDLAIDLATWTVLATTARLLASQLVGTTTQLVETDRRFHLLANDVPAVVYRQSMTGDNRLTWLNAQARAILGFRAEEFLEDPELALRRVAPEDLDVFMSARRDALRGDGVVRYRFDRADGQRIWLEDHYKVITGDDGRPVAVQGVAFDVSARVAAEQAEQDAHGYERLAREELGRLLAAQRSFVQGISHELRTPLTSVAGFATLLAQRGDDLAPDARATIQERLLAGTRRLTDLVDDLVDIDRLAADVGTPRHRAPLDVRTLVEDAARGLASPDHPVTIIGDPGVAQLDADAVQRIVRHVVGNAVRHTPAGTPVRCHLDRVDAHVRVVVEDEGPGVPPELRGRLFEPFAQGEHVADLANPGTGVGLALAATLTRRHGGAIWHETPEHGGARFVVQLRCDA